MNLPSWILAPTRLQVTAAAIGVALAVAAGASAITGRLVYKVEHGKYTALRAQDARQAAERATALTQAAQRSQAAQGALSVRSAETHAAAQLQIVTQTRDIVHEVPVYVSTESDARPCNSVGLIRVLNAAAEGRDPADYQLPAAVSDESCTALTNADVAASVVGNYGIARQNAEQLNALEADIAARVAAANAGGPDPAVGALTYKSTGTLPAQ